MRSRFVELFCSVCGVVILCIGFGFLGLSLCVENGWVEIDLTESGQPLAFTLILFGGCALENRRLRKQLAKL